MNKIGCVIMASGLGRRFGGNKLLHQLQGKTLIQRILEITEGIFEERVVVTRSDEIRKLCEENAIKVIFHSMPNRNDTISLGIRVMKDMDACVFCPSDQPLLKRESMQKLRESFLQKGSGIHRLVYENQEGAPILFGKEYFAKLQELPTGCGGSFLVKQYPEKIERIQVKEPWELFDIDTPEDLAFLEKLNA